MWYIAAVFAFIYLLNPLVDGLATLYFVPAYKKATLGLAKVKKATPTTGRNRQAVRLARPDARPAVVVKG